MNKLTPDKDLKTKSFEPGLGSYSLSKDFGIEFYKARTTNFWDGAVMGLVIGYVPYLWHIYV
tara:strand:+ start:595 stop:780 length:186 start_codon:yes stop_codon:yes gene_type:complete